MAINIIVAVDRRGAIGYKGRLPWHCPEDLKLFKKLTINSTIIMGRLTYHSLPGLLPNREHIVVTSSLVDKRVRTVSSLSEGLEACCDKEVFLIGGKCIIEEGAPLADVIYVTHIDSVYKADTFINIPALLMSRTEDSRVILSHSPKIVACSYV